jgi:hypothetical protein
MIEDFDEIVEPYHQALGDIINESPEGYLNFYSHRDDVTLANPFGPLRVGGMRLARP